MFREEHRPLQDNELRVIERVLASDRGEVLLRTIRKMVSKSRLLYAPGAPIGFCRARRETHAMTDSDQTTGKNTHDSDFSTPVHFSGQRPKASFGPVVSANLNTAAINSDKHGAPPSR